MNYMTFIKINYKLPFIGPLSSLLTYILFNQDLWPEVSHIYVRELLYDFAKDMGPLALIKLCISEHLVSEIITVSLKQ